MSEITRINKTAGGYREVSLDLIRANPDQPRKHFDEEGLDELARSLVEVGLLQPITVRRAADGYVIVAGERRWRAARRAGLATITVKVATDIADEASEFLRSVSENVVRRDMTVMEEVDAYERLRTEFGKTTDEIAETFGKTKVAIEWRLGLITLGARGRRLVDDGTLKPNLAWHIARLSEDDQEFTIRRYMRGDFRGEFEAANFAQALRMRSEQGTLLDAPDEQADTETARAERKARRSHALGQMDRMTKVAEMLADLASTDPAEFAAALGDDTAKWTTAIEALATAAGKARKMARQAKGHAEAATYTLSPDALV